MADYQAGNTDQTSPWYGIDAIQKEVSLNRTIPQVNGEVHYAYHTLFANQPLIDFYQTTYQQSTKIEVPLITDWLLNKKEHHAYMQGSDNMFRPDDGLTRAEAATIFANLLVDSQDKALFDSKEVNYGSFYDVSPTAWYSRAVELMKQCNIVSGYSDGSFQPNKKVTRAEFVTMAYLADKVTEKASANFVDIPQNYWALSYIGFGEKSGWVNGYEDGTFRPNETVTRAEVATIMEIHSCECCHCAEHSHHKKRTIEKLEEILKHASYEFFDVGKYLIFGAILSSIIQVYIPQNMMTNLGTHAVLPLLIMMLAAFVLSICSTSDAFIARTFANSIPISSVMGFMILGPMLDIKNLFMLMGNFKKQFVVKFVVTVFAIAFVVLMTVTKLLFGWWS